MRALYPPWLKIRDMFCYSDKAPHNDLNTSGDTLGGHLLSIDKGHVCLL